MSMLAFFVRTCNAAQRPKAFVAPVLDNSPTKPPKSAQKRNILIFQPSLRDPATTSERFTNAANGLPPATISVPERIPRKSEMITSLVIKASAIVRIGGIRPYNPKSVMNNTP